MVSHTLEQACMRRQDYVYTSPYPGKLKTRSKQEKKDEK